MKFLGWYFFSLLIVFKIYNTFREQYKEGDALASNTKNIKENTAEM